MKSLYKEITIYGTELFRNTRGDVSYKYIELLSHRYGNKYYYDRVKITLNSLDIHFLRIDYSFFIDDKNEYT